MSDELQRRWAERERRRAEIALDRRVRQERIEQYEAERRKAIEDYEAASRADWAMGYAKSVGMGGVRDAISVAGRKVTEGLGWALETVADPVMHAIGKDVYDMSPGEIWEMKKDTREVIRGATSRAAEKVAGALPEVPTTVDDPGFSETLPRSLMSFWTVYNPALRSLGNMKHTVRGDITAGALADLLAFENQHGTIADSARALGIENEFTQYMSGQLSDNEFDASVKAALEGAGLGFAFGMTGRTYRALREAGKRNPDEFAKMMDRVSARPASPTESDVVEAIE